MKRLIMTGLLVGVTGAIILYATRRNSIPAPATQPVAESTPAEVANITEPNDVVVPEPKLATPFRRTGPSAVANELSAIEVPIGVVPDEATVLRQTVEMLVSTSTGFEQKQLAWINLRKEGKLNQVIDELEQGVTNHPTAAEYPAALGQACIHKIATSKDVRDHAMLGMKADQSFDTALERDPKNWEARFFKATSMSFWPAEMNMRPEVIEQLSELIQQQEAQTPQPHFAQTYLWLGDQYQKSGRSDYAGHVWQRGALLFPSDPALQKKIAASP
jgi:hypothetical protein